VTRGSPDLSKIRILFVDDEAKAREVFDLMLTSFGAVVRVAGSAAEAIEIFLQFKPDILVSDIAMPGENGHTMMRRIRSLKSELDSPTPAVALTAFVSLEDRAHALASGFHAHVAKPIDSQQFAWLLADMMTTKIQ
jgi:CheY-like chemotaxis protein